MQTPNELSPAEFWENRYRTADVAAVSWYEPVPHLSLALLELGGSQPNESVIDIGGGASFLAQSLNERGYSDVSVLDASNEALEIARSRWTESSNIDWLATDLLTWTPERTWNAWHDRAVFHFLTSAVQRETYRATLRNAVIAEGFVAVATFAPDGPQQCSGVDVARYSPEELLAELGTGFELIASGRYLHHTPSGAVQPFSWVVARRIA